MADSTDAGPDPRHVNRASPASGKFRTISDFGRWPTGAKLFLILSIALLPFALIALLAGLQTNRIADAEVHSRLRLTANESARALGIQLVGDMNALRIAMIALDADPDNDASCGRVQGIFPDDPPGGPRFQIVDRMNRVLCSGAPIGTITMPPTPLPGQVTSSITSDVGLVLAMRSRSGRLTARVLYPKVSLAEIARPAGFASPHGDTIVSGRDRLVLEQMDLGPFDRTEAISLPLGIGSLTFEMTSRSAPISSPLIIAMLLPVLMWIAAAGLSWFVVDVLLIKPLQSLKARVAAYRPGEEISLDDMRALPAAEITELGETFRTISRTLAEHEAGLAEGLIRQTKLTREVHHRVKNNLQVISSLINFHARGAPSPDAAMAYASIQRRVDALAVVHRNHFAEMEQTRGLGLRSVISDLASNLRSTAPEGQPLAIVLDIDPYLSTQDVATPVAFLLTELIELAMAMPGDAAIRLSLKPDEENESRALLRISAPTLIDSDALRHQMATRYGRVMEGLARQLRSRIHHDPLVGAFEISVAVAGRD